MQSTTSTENSTNTRECNKGNQSNSHTTKSEREKIDSDLWDLEFNIGRSIRYHTKRQKFYLSLHRITQAISTVLCSSAFCLLYANEVSFTTFITAFVAVITILDLVIGYNSSAMEHNDLKKSFIDLMIKLNETEHTKLAIDAIHKERLLIEKQEPPVLTALNTICYNEECMSHALNDRKIKMGWFERNFYNYLSFDKS